MGQPHKIMLSYDDQMAEVVSNGPSKLMENSYIGNLIPTTMDYVLAKDGSAKQELQKFFKAVGKANPVVPRTKTKSPFRAYVVGQYIEPEETAEICAERGFTLKDQSESLYYNASRKIELKNLDGDWDDEGSEAYDNLECFYRDIGIIWYNSSKEVFLSSVEYFKHADPDDPEEPIVHPLSLLLAFCNGRGGGDYDTTDYPKQDSWVGAWAGDEITVVDADWKEDLLRAGAKEIVVAFSDVRSLKERIEKIPELIPFDDEGFPDHSVDCRDPMQIFFDTLEDDYFLTA